MAQQVPSETLIWDLPTQGPPTTDVMLQGAGFDALTAIDIYFDSTVLATTTTDKNGSFGNGVVTATGASSTRLQVPAAALPGQHTITAQEHVGQKSAQKSFLVQTNWSKFGFDLQNTGLNPYEHVLGAGTVGNLVPLWRSCGASYIWSSPAVVNGVVYVGTVEGDICAMDAGTGGLLWRVTTNNQADSTPAVANGVVYVGSDALYALSARTGDVIWKYTEGDDVFLSSPAVVNGVVYVGSLFNSSVYALNASTGALIWKYVTGGPVYSAPAVVNGLIYFGSVDSNVYALNANTGAVVWTYATQGQVDSSPSVVNGVLYIGSFDQYVYALDAATGALIWKYNTSAGVESSPAVADGILYVGASSYYGENTMHALDAKTGALLWQFSGGTAIHATPTVANGVVYIGSENPNGAFYALDAKNGTLLWEQVNEVLSSAAIADGVVYVANGGAVTAYGLPGQQGSRKITPPENPDLMMVSPRLVSPVERSPHPGKK